MREGDVVLALLPQADGQSKSRPALYLQNLSAHLLNVK
jgi:hypothetical protein